MVHRFFRFKMTWAIFQVKNDNIGEKNGIFLEILFLIIASFKISGITLDNMIIVRRWLNEQSELADRIEHQWASHYRLF